MCHRLKKTNFPFAIGEVELSCTDLGPKTRIDFSNELEKPHVNLNKSLANITCEINNKIHMEMGKLEKGLTVVSNLVGFLILLLILEAIWYWWSFIHKVCICVYACVRV